jgi:uncharacterized membrane-anchored protein YjiN (DUF445 family)
MRAKDDPRDERLRRMKWLATGLLVAAGLIYVAASALEPRYAWLYWVARASEAAMVGAIADWFAVVALFHHPLKLRFIPHTAIIPRNKQRIALGLSEFIQQNLLSAAAVVERIAEFRPAQTLCGWLVKPENADALAAYAARFIGYSLTALDDERVRSFLQQAATSMLKKADLAGAAGQVLDVLTEKGRHHELLDAALAALDEILARDETRELIAAEIAKNAPFLKRVSDFLRLELDERAALRIVDVAIRKIHEVRADRGHELRRRFDGVVAGFIYRLKHDAGTREAVARIRDEALESPALGRYIAGLWDDLRAWLGADLQRRPSVVHERIAAAILAFGETLNQDRAIQAWIDEQIMKAVPPLVEEHRAKIGRFIEDQINGWQETRLVAELERHIGPDLQYIRINGTLVGGLAGLAIAAATQLAR